MQKVYKIGKKSQLFIEKIGITAYLYVSDRSK